MADIVRVIAIGGTIGALVAGTLAAPQLMAAVAEEPVKMAAATIDQLFPADKVDPKVFRHYNVTLDDSISTDVKRTQVVSKIGHGRKSTVTIVTTPSGTYSTDALLSPHVRYPGIETSRKSWFDELESAEGGHWVSFSEGSFTYLVFRVPAERT